MIWKPILLLGVVCAHAHGHAISEQKLIRHFKPQEHYGHHGELQHIGEHTPEHHEVYADAYPSYEFSYKVEDPHTHDFKGQEEIRDGDLVKGQYWLIQPDGVKRTVTYEADKHSGFKAIVHYSEPHHELKHEPIHHEPKILIKEEIKHEPKIHEDHEVIYYKPVHKEPIHIKQEIKHEIPKHHEEYKHEHLPILKYYQEPYKYEHHELPVSKYEERRYEPSHEERVHYEPRHYENYGRYYRQA